MKDGKKAALKAVVQEQKEFLAYYKNFYQNMRIPLTPLYDINKNEHRLSIIQTID